MWVLEMNNRVISNGDLSKNQVIRLKYLKTDGVKLTIVSFKERLVMIIIHYLIN